MVRYSQSTLQELRRKIDLIEVISPYVQFQKSGPYFKAVCPFHLEKSPSFVVRRGEEHYHCFGCGAHGDAIQFLMNHLQLSFQESVEHLAERFQVPLEVEDSKQGKSNLGPLKGVLNDVARFYHFCLLHTEEGKKGLFYLYQRGIDLDFIQKFRLGFASEEEELFFSWQKEFHLSSELLIEAGILKQTARGHVPFFKDRVIFPIIDTSGNSIAFSGRTLHPGSSAGPKYLNSPETAVFKKSHLLFGLFYSRQRIVKEKKVLICEGQVDCLRLIYEGFDYAVASQGTAFSSDMVSKLLSLGIQRAYLAFDGDRAGREAAARVGQQLQIEGVEVKVLSMEKGEDPDAILRNQGKEAFSQKIEAADSFISFLLHYFSEQNQPLSPASIHQLVEKMVRLIEQWKHPVMQYQATKEISERLQLPLELIEKGLAIAPIEKTGRISEVPHPSYSFEEELIRWLLLVEAERRHQIYGLITEQDLFDQEMKLLFVAIRDYGPTLLALMEAISTFDVQKRIEELLKKRVPLEKFDQLIPFTIYRILERNWNQKREELLARTRSVQKNSEEEFLLAKAFDELSRRKPLPPKEEKR